MSNVAIWTPSQNMKSDDTHTAFITGTVQDTTGAVRQVDDQISFTTLTAGVYYQDFEDY